MSGALRPWSSATRPSRPVALPPEFFTLVENELYAWKRDRLADAERTDHALGRLLHTIARLAPVLPLEEGSDVLRCITSEPMLRGDGEVVCLTVRLSCGRTGAKWSYWTLKLYRCRPARKSKVLLVRRQLLQQCDDLTSADFGLLRCVALDGVNPFDVCSLVLEDG